MYELISEIALAFFSGGAIVAIIAIVVWCIVQILFIF